MSAPAIKAFSPEPVRRTTRMEESSRASWKAERRSDIVAMLRALRTLGRFTVT
jgi:hypothetical protein